MRRTKVVLLGPAGQLGTEIQRAHAANPGSIELLPVGRDRSRLVAPGALRRTLGGLSFNALVNCSAPGDPDAAERDPATAFALHAHAVRDMATLCADRNARFVHVSADCVFGSDPLRSHPWLETDAAGPVNVLGAALALGETLAEQAWRAVTTVRVGPLFGADEVDAIARLAQAGGQVQAAQDQYISPTSAADAARVILRLLADGGERNPPGKYHVVNGGATSRYGLAAAIVDRLRASATVTAASGPRSDAAQRPRYSVLDNRKAAAAFGGLPPWQEALETYLAAKGYAPPTRRAKSVRWFGSAARAEGACAKTPFLYGVSPNHVRGGSAQDVDARFEQAGFNTGNLAFSHAIDAHLGGGLPSVEWGAPLPAINRKGDLAVIPAANQLGTHTNHRRSAQLYCDIRVPMVMIGLGAQSDENWTVPQLHDGTLDWIRQVAEHAPAAGVPNIGVRGGFSLHVLDRHGLAAHAQVIGCPSFFLNPCARLGERIAANLRRPGGPKRVAVVAGHPHWQHLGAIEASIARLASTPGSYVVQAPEELIRLACGEAGRVTDEALRVCRDYVMPDATTPAFARWGEQHGKAFFDIPGWLEHYRGFGGGFDMVVGTRIHGVVLGLQAGVPSLCVAHDSRTLELCQTLKVPHVLASQVPHGLSVEELRRVVETAFDPAAFDANRRRLCERYVAFLKANGLPVADWLAALGNAPSASRQQDARQENGHWSEAALAGKANP